MLGDFNLAGEIWIVKEYLKKIGIDVVSTITGDSSYDNLLKASSASCQCCSMCRIYDIFSKKNGTGNGNSFC